jgi:hypothetical protein
MLSAYLRLAVLFVSLVDINMFSQCWGWIFQEMSDPLRMIASDVCRLIVGGRCLCYFVLIWKATRHHLWCRNNLNLCDRHGKPSILLKHPTIWESYRAKERELCLGLLLSSQNWEHTIWVRFKVSIVELWSLWKQWCEIPATCPPVV